MRFLRTLRLLLLAVVPCLIGTAAAKAQAPDPNATFVWAIQPIPAQRWDGRSPLPIRVYVGPRSATGVQLLPPNMIEPNSLRSLDKSFILCLTREGRCEEPSTLPANRASVLWARPRGEGEPPPGAYAVTFTLVAAERPQGDPIATTLHVSRDKFRIWGAVLVFLGVLLALLVTRVLRGRSERNALLRPAALLADQLARLKADRAKHDGALEEIDAALVGLEAELALKNVERYLPGTLDFFAAPAAVPNAGETYQAFLTRIGNELGSLSIIVKSGIQKADRERRHASNQKMRDIIEQTVERLDALASPPLPLPDAAATAVRDMVAAMNAELNAARGAPLDDSTAALAIGYSSEQLAFQSTALNLGGWAVFAFLSTIVGIYLLVLRDNDFGQPQDLLLCLLWGFGMPVAGQGLGTLTSGGIASSLGVTLTRAG